MEGFILRWLINAVAIYLTTRIVPGISVPDFLGALLAALALGVVNVFIRPVVLFLTLPINILTLGLFALLINTLMLYLVAAMTPLRLSGFWSAFLGALLISAISLILTRLLPR